MSKAKRAYQQHWIAKGMQQTDSTIVFSILFREPRSNVTTKQTNLVDYLTILYTSLLINLTVYDGKACVLLLIGDFPVYRVARATAGKPAWSRHSRQARESSVQVK